MFEVLLALEVVLASQYVRVSNEHEHYVSCRLHRFENELKQPHSMLAGPAWGNKGGVQGACLL
jgi:hypothetical protein